MIIELARERFKEGTGKQSFANLKRGRLARASRLASFGTSPKTTTGMMPEIADGNGSRRSDDSPKMNLHEEVVSVEEMRGARPAALTSSVIVCAYTEERWEDLLDAVASLRRQTQRPTEVIVVVDHNEELLQRARHALTDVVIGDNIEHRGLSGARNSGVRLASGDVIAFLDDDAVADPDWLKHLSDHYLDPRVIGVGGRVDADWLEGRPRSFPEEFDWVVGCSYRGLPTSPTPVRNAIGASMSFRAKVLARAGAFRSDIGRVGSRPVGCEETELSIRALRAHPGSVVLYEPRARVRHRVPAERARFSYFRSRCYAEGLSKAVVSRAAGTSDALSTERSYAFRTLPAGVVRGLGDFLRGDLAGIGRAGKIVVGLVLTTAGYIEGRYRGRSGDGAS